MFFPDWEKRRKKKKMTDNDFFLLDRMQKIKQINKDYNLLENSYISFSGGKDSVMLSHLVDLALPKNQIPRVFINTGIEYKMIVDYVKECQKKDNRIQIVSSKVNISKMLEEVGYPFKSKEHSQKVSLYQRQGKTKTISDYLGEGNKSRFLCPDKLKYQFTPDFNLKISDKCCYHLKKKVGDIWATENKKSITILGLRQEEGGLRQSIITCLVYTDKKRTKLKKFSPLLPLSNDFVDWYIKEFRLELCQLYKEPYNFKRTGCAGCPFSPDLQEQLNKMASLLPKERTKCEFIWHKVYKEYRRKNYRLESDFFMDM